MLAALVVEAFESVLRAHVELSMFVPLLIGHGGNTGSQSNATVIRSLALGHLKPSDWLLVVYKVGLCGGPLSSAFVVDCCVTRHAGEQCLEHGIAVGPAEHVCYCATRQRGLPGFLA